MKNKQTKTKHKGKEEELNKKIFRGLEEESDFVKTIKDLSPLFFNLAISGVVLNWFRKQLIKENI